MPDAPAQYAHRGKKKRNHECLGWGTESIGRRAKRDNRTATGKKKKTHPLVLKKERACPLPFERRKYWAVDRARRGGAVTPSKNREKEKGVTPRHNPPPIPRRIHRGPYLQDRGDGQANLPFHKTRPDCINLERKREKKKEKVDLAARRGS